MMLALKPYEKFKVVALYGVLVVLEGSMVLEMKCCVS